MSPAAARRPRPHTPAGVSQAGAGGPRGLALVADDLTGAADAAVPFAARGAEVSVVLRWPPQDGVEVLALVSDSRWRAPEVAAERVGRLVRRARTWGADQLFVKIDSTLRGHVRHEVGAALAAWGTGPAVATPAFPAQGRVVRDGVLLVHGVPRAEPVAASLPPGVAAADAEDDGALLELAREVAASGAVAVGSGGLARALAEVLTPRDPVRRRPRAPVRGVLVVVGTPHRTSRGQSAVLVEAGVLCLVVEPGVPAVVGPAVRELARGGRVLVTTPPADDVEGDSPAAQAMADQLASVVRALLLAAPSSALVVTGGSTALAVATVLRSQALRLLDEVAPGVALGELMTEDRPLPTITKSGGFGPPEALLRAVELLEECV